MMQNLFVYNMLHDPDVQLNLFGRHILGVPDTLEGYRRTSITIEDRVRPIAVEEQGMTVEGWIIQLSEEELSKTDAFEGEHFRRGKVKLKSGTEAWVYKK